MDYTEAQECLINTLGAHRNHYILRHPMAIRVGHNDRLEGYVVYSFDVNCAAWAKERNVAITNFKEALMQSYFESFSIDEEEGDVLDQERVRLLQWLIQPVEKGENR